MKRTLTIIGILTAVIGNAQQMPQYTQYMLNQFAINPAVAGTKECLDIKLGYRAQWVGFEGAPRTAFVNINGRIPIKRPRNHRTKHGVGVMAETDGMGPLSRTSLYLAYAFHTQVARKFNLAFGVFAGFHQFRFDRSKVTLSNADDPIIAGSRNAFVLPDIIPGLWFYSDNFYAGLSWRNLLRNDFKVVGDASRFTHHFLLTAGRKWEAAGDWSFIPNGMLKIAPLSPPALDLNVLVDYRNTIAFGLSYRNVDALAGVVRLNFLKYFTVGYSFDLTTSRIRYGSSNTHEVIIGIYSCPINGGNTFECPTFN